MDVNSEAEAALECPICADVLRNASETACGHAFCEFCINKCLETSIRCPVCRKDALPVHPSFALRTLVRTLHPVGERTQLRPATAEEERAAGNAAFGRGEYAEAIRHYSEAADAEGGDRDARIFANRALCLMRTHQTLLAIDDCDRALHIDPACVKAHVRKAQCLAAEGRASEARKAVAEARKCDAKGEYAGDIEEVCKSVEQTRDGPRADRAQQQQRQRAQQQQQQQQASLLQMAREAGIDLQYLFGAAAEQSARSSQQASLLQMAREAGIDLQYLFGAAAEQSARRSRANSNSNAGSGAGQQQQQRQQQQQQGRRGSVHQQQQQHSSPSPFAKLKEFFRKRH
eukprot:m51a1_g9478 putative stress-induced-phosphoprotein 1 (344) ;mRNA; f:596852-598474